MCLEGIEMKCCDNCLKMVEQVQHDSTVKKKCSNDPDGTGIQGSMCCIDYIAKCDGCVRNELASFEFPCFVCLGVLDRPYYKSGGAENVCHSD